MRKASKHLEKKVRFYAISFKRFRKFPAAVSGAEYSSFKEVAKSGINSTALFGELKLSLKKIGILYTRVNNNILGYCAEVNASNKLMNRAPYVGINDITFSKTLRPRTMQVIPMCKNCKKTFN